MQFKLSYEKRSITFETTEIFYLIKCLPKLLKPSIRQENMKSGLASMLGGQGTTYYIPPGYFSLTDSNLKDQLWWGVWNGARNVIGSTTSSSLELKIMQGLHMILVEPSQLLPWHPQSVTTAANFTCTYPTHTQEI